MNKDYKLYSFEWDCGRMGFVEGLFVATEEEIKDAIDKEVYFGEILGKHSEVYGTLEQGDLKAIGRIIRSSHRNHGTPWRYLVWIQPIRIFRR